MDAFLTHHQIVNTYKKYIKSFLSIRDRKIKAKVDEALDNEGFIPEPLIQFNPSFARGESLSKLVSDGLVHPDLPKIFGSYNLYKHQVDALKIGLSNQGFIVTSGTGSGKSLTYLATIFNHLLSGNKERGIKAILVYPMNALINSQEEEIKKYQENYGQGFPISFAKYTGQESLEARERIKQNPPDIILTNYMMLELIMTRQSEGWMRESIKENLEFLIFDELHTYRGRQGSDVSLLIRRIKNLADKTVVCIGTSATMASKGTPDEKKDAVIEVGKTIFSADYSREQIIHETLEHCTKSGLPTKSELNTSVESDSFSGTRDDFKSCILAIWLENRIALQENENVLERGIPLSLKDIVSVLHEETNVSVEKCESSLRKLLNWAEILNTGAKASGSFESFLPFRFHQFISQTSTVFVTLDDAESRTITIEPGRYIRENDEDVLIYPILFSRISGIEFLCVTKDIENQLLLPRNPDSVMCNATLFSDHK